MKRIVLFLLIWFFIGCEDSTVNNDDDNKENFTAELIEYDFKFNLDVPSDLNSNYKISDDTLVIYDYWGAVDQPSYKASISINNDTIVIYYDNVSGGAMEWEVKIETTLKIFISGFSSDPIIKLPAVSNAREPYPSEIGYRDAQEEFIFQFK